MKARKTNSEEDDVGLDSLMDTMFNVVGILVLVLVTTQLDVAEKIREITSRREVSQADLDAQKRELEKLKTQRQELQKQIASKATLDIASERERLNRVRQTIAAQQSLLKAKEKEKNEFAVALNADRKKADDAKKAIEATEKERESLGAAITDLLKKKADLQAMLDQTPKRAGPPPSKFVAIPNPRPAPTGAKRLNFLCAHNRLFPMNIDDIRKDAETRSKAIITRHKLNTDPAKGIDPDEFEKYFLRLADPRDDYLKVEYYIADKRWPRMRLLPNERRGAQERDLTDSSARIRSVLTSINPQKNYVYFYVMPDSYDIYIAIRQLMMARNIQAGWEPVPDTWVYTTSVPGIELGPPRPVDPNAPKPPPPRPQNVLD